ncbi:MAG TPA: TonB-dependent receptor, partial [Gemmatimonadales bacterium]|nr:TonB-dependent receptor [Gemmatimonadales bacterium]
MRLALGLLLPAVASLSLSASLAGQTPDTTRRAAPLPVTDAALRLPVDHASDLLSWLPGGALDTEGNPTWHGSFALFFDRETDGIRWASGIRSHGVEGTGASPLVFEPEFGALDRAHVDVLGGGPATLHFFTQSGGDRWRATGSGETESPFRADGGMGFSRFSAAVGGPLGAGFRLRASTTLLGREAVSGGIGYSDDPYFVPTGIDTTMRWAVGPDSVDALVQRFGATTKVPFSPRSTAGWTVRVDGALAGLQVWGRWIGSAASERFFNYVDVANPLQARGENTSATDLAAGVSGAFLHDLRFDAALGIQQERSEQGPLTSQAQFDSRDPGLGLMLGGLDLRWSMDNFPVDDELLSNYRNNIPGSRRSPYDLENTAQYALVDQFRNNPYAALGWSESGGPQGVLDLYQDHRILARAGVSWHTGNTGSLRIGAEVVDHDVKYYSFRLTSTAFSDVWLEQPREAELRGDWKASGPSWEVAVGARIHHFSSGAKRPYLLNTDLASTGYGTYNYYPRISSYGSPGDTLHHFVEDGSHTAFAPYFDVSATVIDGWVGHATLARSARMPDLTGIYAGVNTDLAMTNSGQFFGTDLAHEVTDHGAAGVGRRWGALSVDASVFYDRFKSILVGQLEGHYDPARNSMNDLWMIRTKEAGANQGITLNAGWRPSDRLALQGAYTFTDTAEVGSSLFPGGPSRIPRRHTFAFSARTVAPEQGLLKGLAAIVSYRRMSGLALGFIPGFGIAVPQRTDGIPAWSSLDLRVTKQIPVNGLDLTVYFDGRNLLNAEDLRRA